MHIGIAGLGRMGAALPAFWPSCQPVAKPGGG